MKGLIRSASLTNFADVARKVRLDPARLLREFGISPRALADPEIKVPIDSVRALLEAAAERSGVEAFGLMMAETRQLSNLGPAGLLIREQPTLRLAVEALARYSRKLNEALFFTLEESGSVVVLREELIVGHGGSVRQSTELALGVAFRTLRFFLGPDWKPLRVCFAHDAPRDRSVHERVFGRNVEFGDDFNGIVCARRDLDVPNPNADPAMARYARQLLESGDAHEPSEVAGEVRHQVMSLLPTGSCTIEVVAQHLAIDRRTLHRRLSREGQTFSDIVDAVRRELAKRYVKDAHRSLAEVSILLGFAAPSGFSRWYRRQFGDRPSDRPSEARPRQRRVVAGKR